MGPTVPWSPIQLWKKHRVAAVVGFIPSVVALVFASGAIVRAPLLGALMTALGLGILGWALAILLACRRWIIASLVLLAVLPLGPMFYTRPGTLPDGANTNTVIVGRQPDTEPSPSPADPHDERKARSPATGRGTAPVDLEPFRQYSKQLVNGVVGFDYPLKMTVGNRDDVRLRVSVRKAMQELRDSLKREGRDPIIEQVKLSPRMKADLQGFGFEIKPLSSVEQLIDPDADTTWTWDVRAMEAGRQRLTVTLTAIVAMAGSEGARDVSTFYREVDVAAVPKSWPRTALDFVQQYGPSRDIVWPAIPTLLVSVWAFLFARRRVQRRRNAKASGDLHSRRR